MGNINLTTERKKYQENSYFLAKDLLGFKDLSVDFHYKNICKRLDQPRNKSIRLWLIPRGFFKTTILTITHAISLQINNPSIRIAIISSVLGNAEDMVTAIGFPYLTNDRFRMYFSGYCPKKPGSPETKWTSQEIHVPNRGGRPVLEGTFEAFGADSTTTSRHFDHLIIDDLVTRENTTTRDQMDKIRELWRSIFPLRDNPKTPIDIIGTRWDDYDLYGDLEKDPDVEVIKFPAYVTINNEKIALWPERYPIDELMKIKSGPKMGTYLFSCLPPDAPILMSDLNSKPICEINVGDKVVGFMKGIGGRRKLVESEVKFVNIRESETIKITTESGRILFCTPDHKWFTGRNPESYELTCAGNPCYRKEYDVAKVGRSLIFCMNPYIQEIEERQKKTAYWLGGIFDGEGHCKRGSIYIAQSRSKNPEVCNAIESAFHELEFEYNYFYSDTGTGNGAECYYLTGGKETKRRFAMWCDPVKKQRIYDSIFLHGGQLDTSFKDKVIKIETHITQDVYNIQTETGNYIAYGFFSKNCLYQQDPVPQEDAVFKKKYFKYFSYNPGKNCVERDDGQTIPIGNTYMTLDGATEEGKNDYSAIVVGFQDHKENVYLLEYFAKQIDPAALLDEIKFYFMKWKCLKYGAQKALVEKMLKSFMKKKQRDEKFYASCEELGKNTKLNKEFAIKQMQPWYEGGYVWHNNNMKDSDLEEQLIRFPKARNDDIIDAQQMLFEILKPSSKVVNIKDYDRNALHLWKKRLQRAMGRFPSNATYGEVNSRTY
ncbi:MAG: hypothetical protein WC998_05575 [Candidatus Paceibacterota bacterium]|jgi:hypothetical protein